MQLASCFLPLESSVTPAISSKLATNAVTLECWACSSVFLVFTDGGITTEPQSSSTLWHCIAHCTHVQERCFALKRSENIVGGVSLNKTHKLDTCGGQARAMTNKRLQILTSQKSSINGL